MTTTYHQMTSMLVERWKKHPAYEAGLIDGRAEAAAEINSLRNEITSLRYEGKLLLGMVQDPDRGPSLLELMWDLIERYRGEISDIIAALLVGGLLLIGGWFWLRGAL